MTLVFACENNEVAPGKCGVLSREGMFVPFVFFQQSQSHHILHLYKNSEFTSLSENLSTDGRILVPGSARLVSRLESYSCKPAGEDKRLFKQMSSEGSVDDLEGE